MSVIFDGRSFAGLIEGKLKWQVDDLAKRPKLIVILDNTNAASVTYTNLKEKFAKRVGIEFERGDSYRIPEYNIDEGIDGIIVQLPFENSQVLINQIDPKKDIDGLRENSPHKSAVVRAVQEIVTKLQSDKVTEMKNIVVVGSKGFVGRKLMQAFPAAIGLDKDDFSLEKIKAADVIISATGQEGLIKPDMVKNGVVAIDLGYPKGDFAPEVADKASFFTPVPGGVGPVTVACLFQNLLDSMHG